MTPTPKRSRFLLAAAGLLALTLSSRGPGGVPAALAACADTVLVRAARSYTITGGSPVTFVEPCTLAAVPGRRFLLEVLKPGGTNPLTSARIAYGGVEYFGSDDVGASGVLLSRAVTPQGVGTLKVTLAGSAGGRIDLRVTQVNEPLYSAYSRTFLGASNPSEKWETRYWDYFNGIPPFPQVLTLTNGNMDSTGAARTVNTQVWFNGQAVAYFGEVTNGRVTLSRDILLEEQNSLEVCLQGSQAGKRVTIRISATDTSAAGLAVSAPQDSFVTSGAKVRCAAQVSDPETGVRLRVNGVEKPVTGGAWSDSLALPSQDGRATFTFVAENGACLVTTQARTVFRDTRAPTLEVLSPGTNYAEVAATSATVPFVIRVADTTRTKVYVDGDSVGVLPLGAGAETMTVQVPLDIGPNGILLRAVDALGHVTEFKRYVYRAPVESLAVRDTTGAALGVSELSATEATPFRSSIQFLYTGANPVQSGLADSTLAAGQEAVIRGRVFARDFSGLPNVTVSVLGRPEFGSTRTRIDGSFDLVVNGGAPLTLRFIKAGFLEVQREATVPVEDYVVLDDLAMIGQRARADSVNTTAAAMAVVSRFESDANGDRKLTLLFAPGTVCGVTSASGTQLYESFHVRLKEFTVGADGDESMPAALPPTTAYTYCVDLGVDEAVQQGQGEALPPSVTFNQPVVAYVKDFLGLPVGSSMPSGYYDQRLGQWVADEDGTIVRVMSGNGGLANFDTDGNGVADTLAQLTQLGITTTERQQVAMLFAPGDSLWRMRIQHFSPHDFNLNGAMMTAAGSRLTANAQSLAQLVGAPEATCGCVIENENRVLGETVRVQGTPYSLHYRSNRQPGDIAMRTIRIPLVGAPVSPDLRRIRIRVTVAGRSYKYDVEQGDIYPNKVFPFTGWDGCDAFGRPVQGSVTATIRVGLEYIALYATGGGGGRNFNNPAAIPGTGGRDATGERSVGRLVWTTQRVSLGAPSMAAAGLGGWTISPHHVFDPNGRGTLWAGDGSFRYAYRQFPVVYRYAGNGSNSTGQTPPLEGAAVVIGGYGYKVSPADMAVGRRDSLYFTDDGTHQVLCISPDKHWHRVAGDGGQGGAITDGDLAISADLGHPQGLAVARDGTVYFADRVLRRVFRVTPDGHIFTVAGTGLQTGTQREDTLATRWPLNEPWGVALGPDGSVFVSDPGDHRVLRIDTSGRIRTYAGTGSPSGGSDLAEGKATELAMLSPKDLAADPQGNLYIAHASGGGTSSVVWRVAPDGRRTIFTQGMNMQPSSIAFGPDGLLWMGQDAGSNAWTGVFRVEEDGQRSLIAGGWLAAGSFNTEDGAFARGVQFSSVTALALDSRGVLYAGHVSGYGGGNGISRIAPELAATTAAEVVFPSEDGRERHIFSLSGRHLRTEDAVTGKWLFTFGYTSGRLTSITDADHQITTIHRNTAGLADWIEAPLGQRTSLTVDPSGQFLASVANANSETYQMDYWPGGLLKTVTNPRQKAWNYHFTAEEGRLDLDSDPAGGGSTFEPPIETDTTLKVVRTTAEGRKTYYDVIQMLDGLRRRIVHRPEHGPARADSEVDSMSVTAPFGEVVLSRSAAGETSVMRPGRDPRFGWLSPVPASSVTTLPRSGRARTMLQARSWSGATFTETATLNGHTFTSAHDTTQHLLTLTSPLSRQSTVSFYPDQRAWKMTSGSLIDPVELGYDALGHLTHLSQRGRAWRYGYDGRGRLASVTDTLGRETGYQYDDADRVTLLTLPGNRVVSYRYDANGNLEGLTPPGGHEHAFTYTAVDLNETYRPPAVAGIADPATRYAYNRDRQLTDVTRPDGALLRLRHNTATGQLDSLTQTRGRTTLAWPGTTGQLGAATSPDGVTSTYAYDGPLLIRETWSGAAAGAVSRTVNDEFAEATQRVTARTDSTSVASFGYDNDGLLTSAAVNGATETITRRASDGLLEATSVAAGGNTVTSRHSYDNHGELWKLRYERNGSLLFEQGIGRDSLGRVTSVTESGPTPHVHEYRYDPAGRLDQVKRDGSVLRSYEYDLGLSGNGNRTAEKDGSGAALASALYDEQDRMTGYGTAAYTYTDNGELVKKVVATADTTRYTYDALGNLTGAHLPGGDSLVYVIDAQDRRVGRIVNGTRTNTWLYANQLNIVAELDGTGALAKRYVYGTQGHVPDLLVRGTDVYRLVTDQLGSVRAVVKVSDGGLPQSIEYDAWGVETSNTNPAFQPLGYAGGLTDRATHLVRFGARDYDVGVGRWTAMDQRYLAPLCPNLFSYACADPVTAFDPDGASPRRRSPLTCDELRQKILNIQHDLIDRLRDYKVDKLNLGERCEGDLLKRGLSRWGHRDIMRERMEQLRELLDDYHDRCGNGPKAPLELRVMSDQEMKEVVGLTGVGAAAYWVISEGSRLLFPPRNLIPVP